MHLGPPHSVALAHIATLAQPGPPLPPDLRVNLHFHPDRLFRGEPLLAILARDGIYRSQFETGTSNGGLTAHPGGDRFLWESRIFAGAYDHAPSSDRPRYGALNHLHRNTGASPRFGSAHFRLAPHTHTRATFCYPDSFYNPTNFALAHRCNLLDLLAADASDPTRDPIDLYIEAHIHGPILIARDVEALVLDPSHAGTHTEDLARALPCPIEFHSGFSLSTGTLRQHPTYRGPNYVALGLALAEHNLLTPRILGDAARSGRFDDQALKRVWHYLARFGATTPPA